MTPTRRANLGRLLSPRHVAFIGGRDAAIAIGEARRIGYRGAMWAVNPKRETLAGLPCFPSVADLPEAPDATFLAVPADQAVEVVRQLGQRGAGGIVCYTAGFGEAGETGQRAEAALIEAVGEMALIGPNCYGIIN
jgi:acyl-CoA synthetase (NDP forming)